MIIEFGYRPHQAQKQIHASKVRFKILDCGRRFGKTKGAAAEGFLDMFPPDKYPDKNRKPTRGWVVAPTYLMTREIERELIDQDSPEALIPRELIREEKKSERRYKLITGDIIEFKSADSENLRGAGLDWMIIDEAARIKKQVWQEQLRPCLSDKQGKAIIISTPFGRNWFWELFMKGQDSGQNQFQSWKFESRENPYFPPEEWELAKLELPDDVFRQEYQADFLDDIAGVFRKVDRAVSPGYKGETPQKKLRYKLGIDLARVQDFTVITVIRREQGGKIRVCDIQRFNNLDWSFQKDIIKQAFKRWNRAICDVDATGVGDAVIDDLKRSGVWANGIYFTSDVKRDLIMNLSILFEQDRIILPDPKENRESGILIEELKSYRYELSEKGRITFGAPPGFHDDCVISLALAVNNLPPLCGRLRKGKY